MKICLAEWMHYKNINPKELSEKLECDSQVISSILTNELIPDVKTFYKISKVLEVPMDVLLCKTPSEYYSELSKSHQIDTNDAVTACILYKYFKDNKISATCDKFNHQENKVMFRVTYTSDVILSAKDIKKICRTSKYKHNPVVFTNNNEFINSFIEL